MLNKIIQFSIHNKLIVGLMVLFLVGFGAYQVTLLPIDAVPDITDNQVQVITMAPSFGSLDIERQVTFPVEHSCSNIAGTKEIRSFSRFGLSLVTIVFEDNIDVYWARQQVSEKLQQVKSQIPESIGIPELGPISTGLGEIYQYIIKPKKGFEQKYTATELRTIQDWIVRRQLLGVKGVAEVSSFGGKLKQFEIAIDPNKLNAFGINIADVLEAVNANNQNTGGAYIEKGLTVLYIRSEGLVKNIEDINNIVINNNKTNVPLLIKDIATVNIGFATRYGALCYNDNGEVAGAIVMMLKAANSSEVIKNVKERVAQIQKTLPVGVEIEAFLDRSKMVNNAISTVRNNLLEGALIVVLILVIFLGNFRAGLIVASVIPLAMLFAICMMNLFGVSGNLMSLGALDFGLIIDGAVIIVESVMHYLNTQKKDIVGSQFTQLEMDNMVSSSAKKMMNSAVFGQIIILIVYLPIFTLHGIEGKMFKPMAQTVAFALLGAFILSLTYVPMMSALLLSKNKWATKNIADAIMHKLENSFEQLLAIVLRFKLVVITVTIVLFILSIFVLSKLGGEFLPELEEGDFAVEARVLSGSNLQTSIKYTQKAAHLLLENYPEVEKIVTKIGSGEVPTDPMPLEAADMMIILKDKKQWTSATTFDELETKMSKTLQDIPGLATGFQFPVQMRFNELMTGARQDVVCKLFGENLDTLSLYAGKMAQIMGNLKGANDMYVEQITGMPQVVIELNRSLLAQYKLSVASVNKIINTSLAGQSAGQLFEDEKRFDILVKLQSADKKNVQDIQNLLIPLANGMQIPLQQIADVQVKNGVNQIQREDAKRRVVVGFNVSGIDVQTIVNLAKTKLNEQIKLPAGYFITYGGSFENLEKAKQRLSIAIPISLLLIFILLFFAFGNLKQSLIIYTAIPLSAIGGIFLLAARDLPFSISAGIGFIALFGVAVLNGIVLIAEYNRIMQSGMYTALDAVLQGTKLRLRPVLMTACVASLGFLPMAISNGAGAEVQKPLANVVIGGLVFATILTLFILPILYIFIQPKIFKMKPIVSTLLLVCCFTVFSNIVFAQTPITLSDALNLASHQNLTVLNSQMHSAYIAAQKSASKPITKTNFSMELGQFNSAYFDNKLAINHPIVFPEVYRRQASYFDAVIQQSITNTDIKINEVKQQICKVYYQHILLQHKQQLLLHADSLYQNFYNKSLLRLKAGESNVLEKTTAQMQKSSIEIQLLQLQQDMQLLTLEFNYLLNGDAEFIPMIVQNKEDLLMPLDAIIVDENPIYKKQLQQIAIDQAAIAITKYQQKPELTIGVSSTTIRGNGADNVTYTGLSRFTSAQVAVAVPLSNKNGKAKLNAIQFAEKISGQEAQLIKTNLQYQYKLLMVQYVQQNKIIANYKNTFNQAAAKISNIAHLQFLNGEINYLDFVTLLNQSILAESNWLHAIEQYNQIIAKLNFLTITN